MMKDLLQIEKNLEKINKENLDKVIIEIPLYSLLWIEKEQKVIDMQIIYMKALKSYISQNNLTSVLNEQTGQNYVEFVKGSIKYRMWLEDEYSINKKIDLATKYNIAGVSLYKEGYIDTLSLKVGDETNE